MLVRRLIPARRHTRATVDKLTPANAAIRRIVIRWRRRLTMGLVVLRSVDALRCGRELRSLSPCSPSARRTHSRARRTLRPAASAALRSDQPCSRTRWLSRSRLAGQLHAFLWTSIRAPSCRPVRLTAFRLTKVAWMDNPLQGTTSWHITANSPLELTRGPFPGTGGTNCTASLRLHLASSGYAVGRGSRRAAGGRHWWPARSSAWALGARRTGEFLPHIRSNVIGLHFNPRLGYSFVSWTAIQYICPTVQCLTSRLCTMISRV